MLPLLQYKTSQNAFKQGVLRKTMLGLGINNCFLKIVGQHLIWVFVNFVENREKTACG